MDSKGFEKLRREIRELRKSGGIKSAVLQSLAKRIGRKRHPRGKEPTWVFENPTGRNPLSIPNHPGDLNKFTAKAILDVLEEDLDYLEESVSDDD